MQTKQTPHLLIPALALLLGWATQLPSQVTPTTASTQFIDQIRARFVSGAPPVLYAAIDGRMVPVRLDGGNITLTKDGDSVVLRVVVPPPVQPPAPVVPVRVYGVSVPVVSRSYSQVDTRTRFPMPNGASGFGLVLHVNGARQLSGVDYEIQGRDIILMPSAGDATKAENVIQVDYTQQP